MSGFNLDAFLKEVEEGTEKVAETQDQDQNQNNDAGTQMSDQEKVAAVVEEGQIMARAFYQELEKIAVGDHPGAPDTGSVKTRDKINHVGTGDIKQEEVDKVNAILANLVGRTQAGVGEIATPAGVVDQPARPVPDEMPLPADQMKLQEQQAAAAEMNKAAANQILSNLYNKYFGEGE